MERLLTERDLITLIESDRWMMEILRCVEQLQLLDGWVCAGFIRSKVWDYLHDYKDRTPLGDIDVIYFDNHHNSEQLEKQYEQRLLELLPKEPWSVKNQARMHVVNNSNPYQSSVDGIAHFPEIPTAIGVRLTQGALEIAAPYGIQQLLSGIVAPTPYFDEKTQLHDIYQKRIHNKRWQNIWPKLVFVTSV
ncbi:nucleotidyltransferase family protein [Lysinibacillus sp. NPDC093197]|uniref:nucleotidyltransferase family protein n=1 Tax=Lysinibacillus sp. NPDC093197 TaxID=3364132 RepID=UPI0037F77378